MNKTLPPNINQKTHIHPAILLGRVIRRQKKILIGTPLISLSACALYIISAKPIYESKTRILTHSTNVNYIESQTEIIKSETIIKKAIRDLELTDLQKPVTNSKFKTLNIYTPELQENSQSLIDNTLSNLSLSIEKNLKAERLPNSYIIEIKYKHQSPHLSAKITNAVTNAYIQSQEQNTNGINGQVNPNTDLTKMLENGLTQAQDALYLHEKKYTRRGPIPFETAFNTMQKKEYENAFLKMTKAKARLEPFLNNNRKLSFNPNAHILLESKVLQELRRKKNEVQQKYDLLATRYGHKHPKIIEQKLNLSILEEQIEHEGYTIMYSLENDYKTAQNLLQSLERPEHSENIQGANKLAKEKRIILENHVISAKALLDAYINEKQNAPQSHKQPTTTWISQAYPPNSPIHPNISKIIATALYLSIIFGLVIAVIREKFRPTFLSGKDLENATGLPCYALIPKDNHNDHQKPSQKEEAIRSLRLTLKLQKNNNNENKVITITSSFSGEGKAPLAINMARLAAKSGERVILIDADLRRPYLHTITCKDNTMSLVEYVTKQEKMEEVINTDDPSGAHIIYGRKIPERAVDILSSERIEQLIRSLRKTYDLIIINTSPCMTSPDAKALSHLSDTVLYTVHWNRTHKETLQSGLSQFSENEKTRIATVLTNINLKKHIEFGFGHSFFEDNFDKNYAMS